MKKTSRRFTAVLLALVLALSMGTAAFAGSFSDVGEVHWAYQVIEDAAGSGVFVGYADGTFKPEASITNAEFVAIITRAYCLANGLTRGEDLAGGNWYDGAFSFAVEKNIMTASQFSGKEDSPISRSDIVLLLSNALPNAPVPTTLTASLNRFADGASLTALSSAYQSAIAKIADAGLVVGDTSGRFNPANNATRAEAATFISRYLAYDPAASASAPASTSAPVADGKILIAAAASLQNAFEKSLIPEFNKLYPGIEVTGTFDSSGRLQTQIESGLEADLFFSAATTQMNNLRGQGLIDEGTVVNLLENKIVLIGTKGVSTTVTEFQNIINATAIAVGDPESVPAGQYAREVFTNLGIWEEVLGKASLGTNVTEVLTWVAAGSAEVGVVYATDAASNENVEVIANAPAGSLNTPVLYPVALTADSTNKPQAQAFLNFLKGDAAKAVFESFGFTVVQ